MKHKQVKNIFLKLFPPTITSHVPTGLLIIIVTVAVFATVVYFTDRQSPQVDTSKKSENMSTPTIQPMDQGGLTTFVGTILPVKFNHSSKLKVYEGNSNNQGFGGNIQVNYDYPDNPSRFLRIDSNLPTYFEALKKIGVGWTYQDKSIIKEGIIATRLKSESIGGKTALVYEWNMLWEMPGPVREYFIPFNDTYIHIMATYSNIVPTNAGNPRDSFDYISAFNEILSTFQIIE